MKGKATKNVRSQTGIAFFSHTNARLNSNFIQPVQIYGYWNILFSNLGVINNGWAGKKKCDNNFQRKISTYSDDLLTLKEKWATQQKWKRRIEIFAKLPAYGNLSNGDDEKIFFQFHSLKLNSISFRSRFTLDMITFPDFSRWTYFSFSANARWKSIADHSELNLIINWLLIATYRAM